MIQSKFCYYCYYSTFRLMGVLCLIDCCYKYSYFQWISIHAVHSLFNNSTVQILYYTKEIYSKNYVQIHKVDYMLFANVSFREYIDKISTTDRTIFGVNTPFKSNTKVWRKVLPLPWGTHCSNFEWIWSCTKFGNNRIKIMTLKYF